MSARLMAAMVDQFCDSYRRAPSSITLDIDDTFDAVHGHQQLSLFNARAVLVNGWALTELRGWRASCMISENIRRDFEFGSLVPCNASTIPLPGQP